MLRRKTKKAAPPPSEKSVRLIESVLDEALPRLCELIDTQVPPKGLMLPKYIDVPIPCTNCELVFGVVQYGKDPLNKRFLTVGLSRAGSDTMRYRYLFSGDNETLKSEASSPRGREQIIDSLLHFFEKENIKI